MAREFYGLARFDHPSPAPLPVLHTHFPNQLHESYKPVVIPSTNGESISALHDRIAYTMHKIIAELDADPAKPKAVLIATHAASMIAMGRALTGMMPEDPSEEDFKCFTCSLSRFERRNESAKASEVELSNESIPDNVPDVGWRDGKGVVGGWNCVVNGDCSFLSGGEERGW
jgi:transcription factor C subunit 7